MGMAEVSISCIEVNYVSQSKSCIPFLHTFYISFGEFFLFFRCKGFKSAEISKRCIEWTVAKLW